MEAFQADASDLDVIAIVQQPLDHAVSHELAEVVAVQGKGLPAAGLEFVVTTLTSAREPSGEFEVSVSSGANWPVEVDFDDSDDSLLIDLTICNQQGIVLHGPPPHEAMSQASAEQLTLALSSCIKWHRDHICDRFHDPGGQNSVLNACRAWRWAVDGVLGSKIEGGTWAIQNGADQHMVEAALDLRASRCAAEIDASTIDSFLLTVLSAIKRR
jgi:streptomycin 3"-adenylyltransferase